MCKNTSPPICPISVTFDFHTITHTHIHSLTHAVQQTATAPLEQKHADWFSIINTHIQHLYNPV